MQQQAILRLLVGRCRIAEDARGSQGAFGAALKGLANGLVAANAPRSHPGNPASAGRGFAGGISSASVVDINAGAAAAESVRIAELTSGDERR